MRVLGLCGTSGSGKSTVASVFGEFGFAVLDADGIYHSLISSPSECTRALARRFGDEILSEDGSVSRAHLRDVVFRDGDTRSLADLNRITHAFVNEEVDRSLAELEKSGCRDVLYDAPLLFESGYAKKCTAVLVVTAPVSVRIRRIIDRDGITYEQAEQRIAHQMSDEEFRKKADFTIINDASVAELRQKISEFITRYREEYENGSRKGTL